VDKTIGVLSFNVFRYPLSVNSGQTSIHLGFDRHANAYDEQFSRTPLGKKIRAEAWELADAAFRGAPHILDLGCGTGDDAIHFAQKGTHVTAVDLSSQMLSRATLKATAAGLSERIHFVNAAMDSYRPAEHFYAIFSNFGALNCVSDLEWLRDLADQSLEPGSLLVLTMLGLFYPLESAAFLLKFQPGKAFRRLRHPGVGNIGGVSVQVHYHSPRRMQRMLGPEFRLERVVGLRAFLPAPGWEHMDRLSMLKYLAPLDSALCRWRPTASWADHFVSVWRFDP